MQDILCLWQLFPVRVECEGGQLLDFRDPGGAKCAGTWTAFATGGMALSVAFFEPLVAGNQKASLASLSLSSAIQTLRGLPCLASFSVVWHIRHTEGPPWLGSCSVSRRIRHIKGHLGGVLLCSSVRLVFDGLASLLFRCRCWRVGREAMVMAPPPRHDSAVLLCFHGCPVFLHRHFPPQSPPLHPLYPSPQSTAALDLDLLHNP